MTKNRIPPGAAREYMAAWAYAVTDHPDLALDLEQCYEATSTGLEDDRAVALRMRTEATWQGIRAARPYDHLPPSHVKASDYLTYLRRLMPGAPEEDLHGFITAHLAYRHYTVTLPQVVLAWLKRRYQGLWTRLPYLSEFFLDHALKMAISFGEFSPAINYFTGPVASTRSVSVDVFEDAENLAPAWRSTEGVTWSTFHKSEGESPAVTQTVVNYVPRHPAMVLHLGPGANLPEARHLLAQEWWRVKPFIGKELGTRTVGSPKSYARDVELYIKKRDWAKAHGGGDKKFLDAYEHHEWRLKGRDISRKGMEKRVKDLEWLKPQCDDGTPASLIEYLADVFGT